MNVLQHPSAIQGPQDGGKATASLEPLAHANSSGPSLVIDPDLSLLVKQQDQLDELAGYLCLPQGPCEVRPSDQVISLAVSRDKKAAPRHLRSTVALPSRTQVAMLVLI